MKNLFALSLVLFSFMVGCKKEDSNPTTIDLGYDYFPVDSGFTRIYRVDSIYWGNFVPGLQDSVSYQVKDINTGTFLDAQGRESYRIERYRRDNDTANWVIWKVYSENLTSTTAERTYNNERFIKLAFQVKKGVKWNGNSFNTQLPQEYEIIEFEEPLFLEGKNYDNTLTVLQIEEFIGIQNTYAEEKYAKGIGMIYRKDINTALNSVGEVTDGYDYTETLLSYSKTP